MVKADIAAGVDKSVLVQASSAYAFDNSYVADSVAAHPERFTGVFSIDVVAPDAVAEDEALDGQGPHRHAHLHLRLDPRRAGDVLRRRGGVSGLAIRQRPGPVGLHADAGRRACRCWKPSSSASRRCAIILDHFARAEAADGPPFASAAPLWALAKYPNVYLKLTHRPIEQSVKGKSTPQAFLGKAVGEFGADRICWGSNFPAAKPPLPELIAMARKALSISCRQQDQDQIFYKTALTLYPALAKN